MSTYSDASLILPVAPERKAGKIYSLKPTDGTGDFTVVRNSTATYKDVDGVIQSVAVNVPRFEWGVGATCPYLLTEPQSTNLCQYSEDLSNAVWTKTNVTITSDDIVAPDGTTTADKVTSTLTGLDLRQTASVTASTQYTLSFYAKKGTSLGETFRLYDVTNGANIVVTDYSADLVNGEWVRIEATITTPIGCTSVYFYPLSSVTTTGYLHIWGVQLEASSFVTSYIPNLTTGTSTRLADVITSGGDATTFNSVADSGVFFIESKALANDLSQRFITISDGTANNLISIVYNNGSNEIRFLLIAGGVTQADLVTSSYTTTDFNKIAVRWALNDFSLWINGVEVITDNSGSTFSTGVLDTLDFSFSTGAAAFYSKTKQVQVLPYQTDTQMTTLTTL